MLIGVISDTHIPDRAKEIPEKVFKIFKDVELIIHTGDLITIKVKETLEQIAPTICVQGNVDRYNGLKLSESKIINIGGINIGINHGEIYPRGDTQQLKYLAQELKVKVLITGHTHQPTITKIDGYLLLNPGSPTTPRLTDPTVMLLNINNGSIEAEIIKIGSSQCKVLKNAKY